MRRDHVVDPDRPITVTATAAGYDSASAVVTVLNSDLPRLSLQIQTPLVTEGDTVAATVSRDTVTDQPLVVDLASSSAANLAPPGSVTIPAYSNSCTFLLLAVDDVLITPTRTYTVTASAAGYASASADVAVADNDLPVLTLTLASTNISEGAGAQATTATVRRQVASSRGLIVALQSSDPTAAVVPLTVTIPAGQYEATFPIGAVNDDFLDGPQITEMIAYATDSLSGNIIGAPVAQALTVTDDDGPTLTVSIARKLVAEGQNPATSVTVRRNTPATNDLAVSLISSDTTEATVPSTVTIPTGQAAATFDIASLDDGVTDGNQSVRITASAEGFTSGHDALVVSDINLADLVIASITAPTNGLTEQSFNVTYRLVNQGLAASTNRFKQRVLLSSDPYLGDDTLLGQYDFNGSIPPGQYFEQTVQLRLPRPPGNYWVVVAADVENSVAEGQEENNAFLSTRPIQVVAEYAATVQTDVTTLRQGEAVPFYGTATLTGGGPAAYKLVNLHLEVRGIQRVIAALTDVNGNFSITFNPLPGEAGHYMVGAAHPGQSAAPVQDEFTILGMKLNPASVTLNVVEDGSVAGSVKVQNLSELPLQGLTATVSNAAGNLLVAATMSGNGILPGLGELELGYAVTANDAVIRQSAFTIHVTCAEGLALDLPVYVYVEPLRARLTASPGELVAGMARGGQAVVTFQVANVGGVPTGPIAVVIPEAPWLHVASTNPLPSLAPGETNQVILLLTPAADLALGPYTGSLALNGSGVTLSVPFNFRALSEAKGDLRVTAVDEYTYYAEGSPRVTNAMVTVSDAVTKQVLTNGVTDADGAYLLAQIQEGYYEIEVSATKHLTYRGTTLVVAGQTNDVPAFLPRQTVQYIWTVVPTEIEDRTIITLETEFETDVPVPVVTVEPTTIDLIDLTQPGQVLAIDLKISNHGLIAAQGVNLAYEPHPWYDISPLIQNIGVLPAKSSLTIPLAITRRVASLAPEKKVAKASAAGGGGVPCDARIWVDWFYPCGEVSVANRVYIPTLHAAGGCVLPVTPMNFPSVGSVQWGPTGTSAYGGDQGSLVLPNVVTTPSCDPCLVKSGLECMIGFTGVGCLYGGVSCFGGLISGGANASSLENCAVNYVGCQGPIGNALACVYSYTSCKMNQDQGGDSSLAAAAMGLEDNPQPLANQSAPQTSSGTLAAAASPGSLSSFDTLDVYATRSYTLIRFVRVLLDDTNGHWFSPGSGPGLGSWLTTFGQAVQTNTPDGALISASERAQLLTEARPGQVTDTDVSEAIDRWNRTITYWRSGITNLANLPQGADPRFLTYEAVMTHMTAVLTAFAESQAGGYDDPLSGFFAALAAKQRGDSGGVCARVKLRINQEAVIAREAFNATLELINSSPTILEGIAVDVVVRNEAGQDVTEWFGLRPPVLDGLSGVDGSGVVNANASGSASWIIIPTSDAAPETATRYFVGGTLRYTQEGIAVTVPLTPAPITVHPNPRLIVKYFHQRDVFSDDPFTDAIEPAIPFSLAVMIQNQGMGVARNVRITSAQPQIIENEKGLLIDFNIIATEVAGQNLTPSLTANFGAIDPGQIAIGRWLLTASLQGLFIDYQASFEHIDGLGNKKLSLIESVEIHEMIHLVHAGGASEDGKPDFLVNDVVDVDDRPDTLYLSDGTVQPVSVATDATADGPPTSGDLEVLLTVNMPAGWTYLRVPDPGNGQYRLVGVRRSDGINLLADNFWTTDRTFLGNAKRPIRENILHLLDYNGTGTYTLIYAPPVPPDTTPPASVVAQLPANCPALIPLSWTGSDNADGSGLAFYDIYVSVNGGPFTPWLQQTPQHGAIYPGAQDNTYAFFSVATDRAGNREAPPAAPDTQTTATLVNTTPLLAPLPVQTVNEGEEVTFSAAATDAEAPPQTLTYSLTHAPAGMTIHPVTGLIRWPTGEANGPSTNIITMVVRDNGAPALGATQTVTVVVNEVNTVPALREIADHVLTVGETLLVTNRATDLDLPAQTLTFHLEAAPPGLTLHPVSGLLRWTPSAAFASTTNVITVRVTDNSPPNLSAMQSFRVIVLDYLSLGLGSTVLRVGDNGDVPINVFSSAGVVDLSFAVDVPSNRLANLDIGSLGPQIGSASIQVMGTRSVINISTSGGQPLLGAEQIASFQFTTVSNASALVPLLVGEVVGTKSDGTLIPRAETRHGRVVVIGDQPLLEAILLTNQQVLLVLYGIPGTTYRIEGTPSISEPVVWMALGSVTLTRFIEVLEPLSPSQPTRFFRARQE